MKIMLLFVLVLVSMFLFFLGGMGIWHLFLAPAAPTESKQYQDELTVFVKCAAFLWFFSVIVCWAVISWFRGAPKA
jgi:tetrahydromethanopterin S-methyltransferase subunit C